MATNRAAARCPCCLTRGRPVPRRPSTSSSSRAAPSATLTARTASSSPRRRSTRTAASAWTTTCSTSTSASSSESHLTERVAIAWQGGEPTLMGLRFFERLMALVSSGIVGRARSSSTPSRRTAPSSTRNGRAFFHDHGFLVGLSMDGPAGHPRCPARRQGRPAHPRQGLARRAPAQRGWRRVQHPVHRPRPQRRPWPRGLSLLPRRGRRIASSSSSPSSSGRLPELIEIAEAGWGSHVEGRPLYTQTGSLVTCRSIGSEQWGRFLIDVFEEWVRRDVGRVFVQMFDVTLANFVGAPSGLCVHSETCGNALAMEHNGDLYSCDHFVEPRYRLGNIAETHLLDLVASPQQRRFGLDKRDTLPRFCRECDVRFACHGGCPKDRFRRRPLRRAWAELPVRRLQGLLRPCDPADAAHGVTAADGPSGRRGHARLRHGGRRARSKRGLLLRQRPQVQGLPRRCAAALGDAIEAAISAVS